MLPKGGHTANPDFLVMSRPAPGHPNAPTFPQPWNLIEPMALPHGLPSIQYGKAKRACPIPQGRAPTPPEYTTPPILGEDVNGDLEEDNVDMVEDRDFYEPNLPRLLQPAVRKQ